MVVVSVWVIVISAAVAKLAIASKEFDLVRWGPTSGEVTAMTAEGLKEGKGSVTRSDISKSSSIVVTPGAVRLMGCVLAERPRRDRANAVVITNIVRVHFSTAECRAYVSPGKTEIKEP